MTGVHAFSGILAPAICTGKNREGLAEIQVSLFETAARLVGL